ncbi:hypothetical protein [Micromonospora rhizosphaerae]|uniref:hypothetical protein n=1 Tax=Micromonospora rhizosphaerae TaxID=568872 RepID=UPI00114D275B|nr:hypothetical protein [Micromonospora rhizosphaerae]
MRLDASPAELLGLFLVPQILLGVALVYLLSPRSDQGARGRRAGALTDPAARQADAWNTTSRSSRDAAALKGPALTVPKHCSTGWNPVPTGNPRLTSQDLDSPAGGRT